MGEGKIKNHTNERKDGEAEGKAKTIREKGVEGAVKDSDSGDDGGEDDLRGKDAIDLANESPSELVLAAAEAGEQRATGLQIELPLLHLRVGRHLRLRRLRRLRLEEKGDK